MSTQGQVNLSLNVRYQSATMNDGTFEIYIDENKLKAVDTQSLKKTGFYHEEYRIPADMLQGKQEVSVRFLALPGKATAAIYRIRLVKEK